MIPTSREVIRTAFSEVGYSCKGKNDKYALYIDKNFPTFYNGKKYGIANFCDIYCDYCVLVNAKSSKDAEKVLCQPSKSCGAGVKWSYKYYKQHKRNTSIPHYGDQIFLSKNGKQSGLYHTGLVYKVTSKYVYFTAANESAGDGKRHTKKHKYLRKNKKIFAYGRPFYSDWKDIK